MINSEEFYKKIVAGDIPDLEDVDDVFGAIEMMIDEVKSAHTILEDLEDALEESQKQAANVLDTKQVRQMPKRVRHLL